MTRKKPEFKEEVFVNRFVMLCCCAQVCMLCSVGYHLFCCHRSEKTSRRWLALDYAGISVGILGCYVPGVFYAFYCDGVRQFNPSRQLFI